MKQIKFKTFEQFLNMKFKPTQDADEILFYSRLFGNRDWGYCITGFYNVDLEKQGEFADYIQVQFFTHDLLFAGNTLVANPKNKVMTLKGITEDTFNTCCEWIEKQRKELLNAVENLVGEVNALVDLEIQEEILQQEVISND